MKELIKKLTNEKNELHNKIFRLEQFINYDMDKVKGKKQKDLLLQQIVVMKEYEQILESRIEDLKEQKNGR